MSRLLLPVLLQTKVSNLVRRLDVARDGDGAKRCAVA